MTGDEFKKEIKSSPKNVYCLVSSDGAIIDLYLKRFKEAGHANRVVFGEIAPSMNLLKQITVSVLYQPKLDESVFERSEYIFIHTDSVDKRTKTYQTYKDHFIEVTNDYVPFVMDYGLSREEATEFVKKCGNDLGIIKNSLPVYLAGGQIHDYSNDVYLWVNNFISRKELPEITESPIGVLALLTSTCQNILRIKANDVDGMNPYLVKKTKELIPYRTDEELQKIISTCFWLDCKVKRGEVDIEYILDYTILIGEGV